MIRILKKPHTDAVFLRLDILLYRCKIVLFGNLVYYLAQLFLVEIVMSSQLPALSVRYHLTLEESQDGFALATFGKKQVSRFLTPAISVAVIIWGFYLGVQGVGQYYVALGAFFLMMQAAMRYWLLPLIFKRQFVKYQLNKAEQGIDLFQEKIDIYHNGRQKQVAYTEVQNFAEGKLTYMLELKDRMVLIVPKHAFADNQQQDLFTNSFKK